MPSSDNTSQGPSQGEYHSFKTYGMEPLDDLLVASDLDAEDKQQQPDEQGDDLVDFL